LSRNSYCATEKSFDSSGAALSVAWKACQARSVATSVSAKIAAIFGMALSWRITARSAPSTPAAVKNAAHGKPGEVVAKSASASGL